VSYSEVIASRFTAESAGYNARRTRSLKSITRYGQATLCATCRIQYERLVRDRELGRKLVNYGFGALLLGAVLFVLVALNMSISSGVGAYLLATPVVVGSLVVLAGGALYPRSKHPPLSMGSPSQSV
jgi:hypothetical protein